MVLITSKTGAYEIDLRALLVRSRPPAGQCPDRAR